jgi:putative ABC transport system substrate-binding protein
VENLGRPGRNITGFSIVAPELGTKRLQLLKETVPGISSLAVLLNGRNPQAQIELREMKAAAAAMALEASPIDISVTGTMQDAFIAMNRTGAEALAVLTDPVLFSERKLTVDLANANRLPAVYPFQGYVEDGGLMSYGPSDTDLFRRSADYVDKILGGIKPGDLPVEQPSNSIYTSTSTPQGRWALRFRKPFSRAPIR